MATANNQALNCSNCGGKIQYNHTYQTSKCLYCGSEFKKDIPDDPYMETFVEVPASLPTPEDNSIVYNMMFKQRPSFWKGMLRGLGFWAIWFIVAAMIQGAAEAFGYKGKFNNLFLSQPGEGYWFLRGILFCVVYPIMRRHYSWVK